MCVCLSVSVCVSVCVCVFVHSRSLWQCSMATSSILEIERYCVLSMQSSACECWVCERVICGRPGSQSRLKEEPRHSLSTAVTKLCHYMLQSNGLLNTSVFIQLYAQACSYSVCLSVCLCVCVCVCVCVIGLVAGLVEGNGN